jgi:carboxyl-terminal processing protease
MKSRIHCPFLVKITLFVSLLLPFQSVAHAAKPLEQFNEVFNLIETMHFGGLSSEKLRDAAIKGMVEALNDPYTAYYNPQEWEDLRKSFNQTFVGIGIRFVETSKGLQIQRIYQGSSAELAGLRPGDTIIKVDGKTAAGRPSSEVRSEIIGPEGTIVQLEILPYTGSQSRTIPVTRKSFQIPSVDFTRTDENMGYIKISSFSRDTAVEVTKALNSFMANRPVSAIILDVRNNPGGFLDAVESVSKQFINNGRLLYTIDRNGTKDSMDILDGKSIDVPTLMLVNKDSASASEIFAGALQDYERAILIGTQTFGKGSVQQLIPLSTGGGLRLTIEQYLTPLGQEVHNKGIKPHLVVNHPLQQVVVALKKAGTTSLRIQLEAYQTFINGIVLEDVVQVLRENGRTYVRSTALAALMDGKVEWNGRNSQITLQGMQKSGVFGLTNGLKLKDGSSYIEINGLTREFPAVKIQATEKTVLLELN